MAGTQLSDGNPLGMVLGQSTTDKLGFFGLTTPIVRRTCTSLAALTAGGTTTATTAALVELYAALAAYGIIV